MKTICAVILTVVLPTLSNLAQQSQRTWPWSAEYTPSERGPHHTRWIKLSVATDELGIASVRARYFSGAAAGSAPPWKNVLVQDLSHAVPDSKWLNKNMETVLGVEKPGWMAAHHIVEKADTRAAAVEARRILDRAGVKLDEAANGVWLPRQEMLNRYQAAGRVGWVDGIGPVHEGNAPTAYLEAVLERLQAVEGQSADVIRDELQRVAKEIIDGGFSR